MEVVHCEGCGGAWVVRPPSLKALKDYYDEGAYGGTALDSAPRTLERLQAKARWNFIIQGLNGANFNPLPAIFSVADVGAGSGDTLEVARALGLTPNYCGYESSDIFRMNIARMGGKACPDFFEATDKETFDLVWASHILEHYSEPDILLQKIGSRMNASGYGFVEIPCLDYEFKKDVTSHLLFFTLEALQKTLERNGFKVIRIDTCGKFRTEAQELFQENNNRTVRRWLKNSLPKRVVRAIRQSYIERSSTKQPTGIPTVEEVLANHAFAARWEIENYGGGRCWLRALFHKR